MGSGQVLTTRNRAWSGPLFGAGDETRIRVRNFEPGVVGGVDTASNRSDHQDRQEFTVSPRAAQ